MLGGQAALAVQLRAGMGPHRRCPVAAWLRQRNWSTQRNLGRAAAPELQAAVGLKGLDYTTDVKLKCLSHDWQKPPGANTATKQAMSSVLLNFRETQNACSSRID